MIFGLILKVSGIVVRPRTIRSISSAGTEVWTGVWWYSGWNWAFEPLKGSAGFEERLAAFVASRALALPRFSSRAAEYSSLMASPSAPVIDDSPTSFSV